MRVRRFICCGVSFLLCVVCGVAQISNTNRQNAKDSQCLSDSSLDSQLGSQSPNACCQKHVCNIPCAEELPSPKRGYGIAVGVSIAVSFLIGFATLFMIHGQAENFFVAGRSLSLAVISVTLASQSIDSNSLLGNADLSYKFHFYDGAVIPIGLGLSLVLNSLFFAGKIQREEVLTLPDIYAKRYGRTVEVLVSIATMVSFVFLLAGNLVGLGQLISFFWGIDASAAVWLATAVVWLYTACGGLFSVAYTDAFQGAIGWLGGLICSFWLLKNISPGAAPPSRGFPGYIYPDKQGENGVCDLYEGVSCIFDATACCFNNAMSSTKLEDNGAFPLGDQRVFDNQMFNPLAMSPFPNAIFWNWATIFILAFGNLGALDFQARCMASRTPRIATIGCLIAAFLTFLVGIPFSYLGSITRVFYGPDSKYAEFDADTCSEILGLPTCAKWVPNPNAFLALLTQQAPAVLGGWCLISLVAASMSTSDGAILALGTVFSHNVIRQLTPMFPKLLKNEVYLVWLARASTLLFAVIGGTVAAYSAGITGKLLIVAFDVVLATVIAPLFGAFYSFKTSRDTHDETGDLVKGYSPCAALLSFLSGAITRIVLEFALPKDDSLLLPYNKPEFRDYGPAPSLKYPTFVDAQSSDVWNPVSEPCKQNLWRDFTGVDSLTAFAVSVLVFILVQVIENFKGGPLFRFPGDMGYHKAISPPPSAKLVEDDVETNEHLDDDLASTSVNYERL